MFYSSQLLILYLNNYDAANTNIACKRKNGNINLSDCVLFISKIRSFKNKLSMSIFIIIQKIIFKSNVRHFILRYMCLGKRIIITNALRYHSIHYMADFLKINFYISRPPHYFLLPNYVENSSTVCTT